MAKKEIIVISQEPLANCERFSGGEVENRIFTIRGVQVILDRDLAEQLENPNLIAPRYHFLSSESEPKNSF